MLIFYVLKKCILYVNLLACSACSLFVTAARPLIHFWVAYMVGTWFKVMWLNFKNLFNFWLIFLHDVVHQEKKKEDKRVTQSDSFFVVCRWKLVKPRSLKVLYAALGERRRIYLKRQLRSEWYFCSDNFISFSNLLPTFFFFWGKCLLPFFGQKNETDFYHSAGLYRIF